MKKPGRVKGIKPRDQGEATETLHCKIKPETKTALEAQRLRSRMSLGCLVDVLVRSAEENLQRQ